MASAGCPHETSDAEIEGVCNDLKDALTALRESGCLDNYDRVVDVLRHADTLTDSLLAEAED